MTTSVNPRLENLLASLTLGVYDDTAAALDEATGLGGAGSAAVLALQEFLGGASVGRVADVCGLTHSGAVRLVALLEREGLAERMTGADRRTVQVRLTAAGRARVARARQARADVLHQTFAGLDGAEATQLEALLEKLITARVRSRMARRRAGGSGAWWCRTCDFAACGRPEGRCPAQVAAVEAVPE